MKSKKHLTTDDRTRVATLLHESYSLRYIADRLDKSPSTISREIHNHTTVIKPNQCDCLYSTDCTLHHVCGASGCKKKCKTCSKAKKYCQDYNQVLCDTMLEHPLHLCNACSKKGYCHYERHIYQASTADKEYRETLVGSRNGFDLTAGELAKIDGIVTPLVKNGQSVYHIVQTNKAALSVSESTVRRLIGASELTVRNIDLPEAVKRKPRRKPQSHPAPPASKEGIFTLTILHLSSRRISPRYRWTVWRGFRRMLAQSLPCTLLLSICSSTSFSPSMLPHAL